MSLACCRVRIIKKVLALPNCLVTPIEIGNQTRESSCIAQTQSFTTVCSEARSKLSSRFGNFSKQQHNLTFLSIRFLTTECGPDCKELHHHHHDHQTKKQVGKNNDLGNANPAVEHVCWSCDTFLRRGGLICGSCDKIQPVDTSLNYFELFSLPSDLYDVDSSQLEKQYRRLQWGLHPDRAGRKAALEREFSKEQASTVNLAYSVLKSPLSRANYLLMLKGVDAGDNFKGSISDPELLMEVLEAREEVEETEDQGRLTEMLGHCRSREQRLVRSVSEAFRSGDLEATLQLVHQLTYVTKLQHEIMQKLEKSI